MMLCYILFIISIPSLTLSLQYGTVSQAQLVTIQSNDIWLYNQPTWSECMCQALKYELPSIVAFNYFINNQTCQLISNNFTLLTSFYMIFSSNSTVFILNKTFTSQLKSICCSDISWLLNNIQQSNTFRNKTVSNPMGLALNTELNRLVVVFKYNTSRAIQQRNTIGNMTAGSSPYIKDGSQPVTYHQGIYYVGISPPTTGLPNYMYVYNTSLTGIGNLSLSGGYPQRAIWLYNDTLMCVIIQNNSNSSIVFLNWYSSSPPFNFTYNRTISVPFDKPYGLTKSHDDQFLYVSGNSSTIYQLSTITFLWSKLISNENSTEIPMSLTIDSCGDRLWVLMLGFGIRIYDRRTGTELASWNMSTSYPTLYDMVLTNDYELYLIDYSMNQLIHYGLSLKDQCISNE